MAFPTYIAKGTFTESTANPSANPPLPSGIQNGDLIIAVISYPVTNTPTSSDSSWTLLAQTSTGTSGNAGCIGIAVFYAIYAGSALGGFSTNASFPLKTYQTYAFRKARIPSVSATSVQSTASTSWTLPSITTTDADSFVFFAIGNDRDATSTTSVSSYTNSNLANITELHDETTATGLGGGIATVYAQEATASSIGTTSATSATSNTASFITFAISPAIITADGATYNLTGQDVTIVYGRTLVADGATYSYNAQSADVLKSHVLTADSATYALTGQEASIVYGQVGSYTLVALGVNYALTAENANLTVGRILVCDETSYSYSAQDADITKHYTLIADGLAYTYSGQGITLSKNYALVCNGASYAYTGQNITLFLTSILRNVFIGSVKPNKIYINGNQVFRGYIGNTLFWDEPEPPNIMRALSVNYSMTLAPITMRHGYKMLANGATYTRSFAQCTLKRSRIMSAGSATYSMTASAVTLTKTGAVVNPLLGGSAIGEIAYSSGDSDAYITFNANGTISATATPDFLTDTVNGQRWHTTSPDQTYQIYATQISTSGTGTVSGTIGSWLSFPQTWGVEKLGGTNGTKNRVLRFQIRRQSDTTIVSNGTNDYTIACSTSTGDPP